MAQIVYMPFPSVEARATPPNDYINVPTRPQEFGAQVGQGLEQFGAGATKAGQFYGEVAADDATNKYMTASRNVLFGDPTKMGPDGHPDRGFYGLEGRAAMDAQAGVAAQLETLRTQIGAGLMTPASRLQFDSETRRFQDRQSAQIGFHANTQAEHWYNEVEKSSIDVNRANLNDAVSRNDGEGIKHASADLVGSYERRASRISGNDPDVIHAATVDGKRDAATTQVMALAPKDPVAAMTALEGYRSALGAAEYEKLHNQLKKPLIDKQAQDLVYGPPPAGAGKPMVSPPQVTTIAQAGGVDPALANATAAIESGHGANVGSGEHAATRGNIFQMGPQERASVGGSATMGSPDEQIQQGVQFLAKKREEMTASLGRAPSNAEIYLAHQQGTAGATKLLSHPDQRAGDLVGDQAIRNNGGDPNAPASAFTNMWAQHYTQVEQHYGGQSPDVAVNGLNPPSLSEKIDQIMASGADPEVKEKAMSDARSRYSAQYADESRAYEHHQRQVKLSVTEREAEIRADAYSDNPQITAQQISKDPILAQEQGAADRMIALVTRSDKPEPIARISQQTSSHMLEDIRRPAGDSQRIEDMKPIDDAYIQGKLTRSDHDWLQKQLTDVRSPQGERLAAEQTKFFNGIKPFITRANPLMGKGDAIGDANFYMFNWMVDHPPSGNDPGGKVQQYRQQGKDPFDLFNPSKPDYVGSPAAIERFQGSFEQSEEQLGDITHPKRPPAYPADSNAPPQATGAAAGAPQVQPRLPGESLPDWVARTHAMPGTVPPNVLHPAPASPATSQPAPPIR